jgi:hypothetical protein
MRIVFSLVVAPAAEDQFAAGPVQPTQVACQLRLAERGSWAGVAGSDRGGGSSFEP